MLRRGREYTGMAVQRISKTAAATAAKGSSAQRREQILAGAAQLFVERGYGGTTVRDIAAAVGMMAGSVYHHFAAKEEVFVAVHQEGFRQLIAGVEAAAARGRSPWHSLELACAAHLQAVVEGNAILRIAASGLFAIHEGQLQLRLAPDRQRYDDIFRRLLAELDLPRRVDRSLLRLNLFGALNWSLLWYRPGRKTPAQIAHQLVGVLSCAARSAPALGRG